MRLSQFLAHAGVASRRGAEQLIAQGRVQVNGEVVTTQGAKVDESQDSVRFDGKPVCRQEHQYFLFYKPQRVMCTSHDPQGRSTVLDYFSSAKERLYTVGRLDYMSEGLIIVTNDGELANRLTHPRYGMEKEYEVEAEGIVTEAEISRLSKGVLLADGMSAPAGVRKLAQYDNATVLSIAIREGRNREVRRMLEALGHRVRRLKRVRVGELRLTNVRYGEYRALSQTEIDVLKKWR